MLMPSRNIVKQFDAPAYYHVYNRGAGGRTIFQDDDDRLQFIALLDRYLNPETAKKRTDGLPYPTYDIQIAAYCLMANHFHMLIFQPTDVDALTRLMRSVGTAYTMYFNKKYGQKGHLFQSIFKASRIDSDTYLVHVARYIHMNPREYTSYKWSSLGAYYDGWSPPWLQPELANDGMTAAQYAAFLKDYEDQKDELEHIKAILASS